MHKHDIMTPYEKNISEPIKERYVICPLLIINVLFQPRLAVNSCLFIATLLSQSTCSQNSFKNLRRRDARR